MGTIEEKLNHNNLGANYLGRALVLSIKDKNPEQKAKILLELSKVYEKLLDLKKSYYYLKTHTELKDSLSHLNNQKLDVNDYVDFKESERLKEIDQMTKENEAQQKTNKFAKLITILAISLITILSLLSLSLYKNNIIRSQSNVVLKEKNFELQIAKDNAEKGSLLDSIDPAGSRKSSHRRGTGLWPCPRLSRPVHRRTPPSHEVS